MRVFHQSSVSRGGYYMSTLSLPSMFTVVEEKSLSGEILVPFIFLFYFIENINIAMKLVNITPKFDMRTELLMKKVAAVRKTSESHVTMRGGN